MHNICLIIFQYCVFVTVLSILCESFVFVLFQRMDAIKICGKMLMVSGRVRESEVSGANPVLKCNSVFHFLCNFLFVFSLQNVKKTYCMRQTGSDF